MTGQLYPAPDQLRNSQAGLHAATTRIGWTVPAGTTTEERHSALLRHQAKTVPPGSLIRTFDGDVYRRLNNGHWALLGPVAYRPDTPDGHLIHRAQEQS